MNKTINIKLKYLLLFIVAFLVMTYLVFQPAKEVNKIEKTVKETVEIKKKIDSASVDLAIKKPVKVKVNVSKTGKVKVQKKQSKDNTKKTVKKDSVLKSIDAFRYQDTLKLKNGTLFTDILSTGKLLRKDIKLINFDTIFKKTSTVKETIYLNKNVWFLNVEPKFVAFPSPAFVGGTISIDYSIRNKFRIGTGVEYNSLLPANNKIMFNFKIGIAL
ncbi:hypothetical protein [Polaribacter aestuariivivens]|uniref:hypothetical protein n=1 Tax=Polaribacter aestuariivivens TaxID=2304626 RepID=UPI003F493057